MRKKIKKLFYYGLAFCSLFAKTMNCKKTKRLKRKGIKTMINKAQEKAYQSEVLSKAYDYIENLRDDEVAKVGYYERKMNESLEENENYDTEYYTNNIDEAKQKMKVIEKVMEMVYKLM